LIPRGEEYQSGASGMEIKGSCVMQYGPTMQRKDQMALNEINKIYIAVYCNTVWVINID
jgi:hypothetical protein